MTKNIEKIFTKRVLGKTHFALENTYDLIPLKDNINYVRKAIGPSTTTITQPLTNVNKNYALGKTLSGRIDRIWSEEQKDTYFKNLKKNGGHAVTFEKNETRDLNSKTRKLLSKISKGKVGDSQKSSSVVNAGDFKLDEFCRDPRDAFELSVYCRLKVLDICMNIQDNLNEEKNIGHKDKMKDIHRDLSLLLYDEEPKGTPSATVLYKMLETVLSTYFFKSKNEDIFIAISKIHHSYKFLNFLNFSKSFTYIYEEYEKWIILSSRNLNKNSHSLKFPERSHSANIVDLLTSQSLFGNVKSQTEFRSIDNLDVNEIPRVLYDLSSYMHVSRSTFPDEFYRVFELFIQRINISSIYRDYRVILEMNSHHNTYGGNNDKLILIGALENSFKNHRSNFHIDFNFIQSICFILFKLLKKSPSPISIYEDILEEEDESVLEEDFYHEDDQVELTENGYCIVNEKTPEEFSNLFIWNFLTRVFIEDRKDIDNVDFEYERRTVLFFLTYIEACRVGMIETNNLDELDEISNFVYDKYIEHV